MHIKCLLTTACSTAPHSLDCNLPALAALQCGLLSPRSVVVVFFHRAILKAQGHSAIVDCPTQLICAWISFVDKAKRTEHGNLLTVQVRIRPALSPICCCRPLPSSNFESSGLDITAVVIFVFEIGWIHKHCMHSILVFVNSTNVIQILRQQRCLLKDAPQGEIRFALSASFSSSFFWQNPKKSLSDSAALGQCWTSFRLSFSQILAHLNGLKVSSY